MGPPLEAGEQCFVVCENCQEITELRSVGITIYRYKINLGNVHGDKETGDLQVSTGTTKDVFIVMNSSNVPDLGFFPDDTSNKIKCKRCQYIAKRAQKYLERDRLIHQEDIAGICDHCRSKQQTRDVRSLCDQIITKYFIGKHRQEMDNVFTKEYSPVGKSYWDTELNKSLHRQMKGKTAHESPETSLLQAPIKFTSKESITPFPELPITGSQYPKNTFLFPKDIQMKQKLGPIATSDELIQGIHDRDRILHEERDKNTKTSQKEAQMASSDKVSDERRGKHRQGSQKTYESNKPDKQTKGKPWEETEKRSEKRKDKLTEKEGRMQERSVKRKLSDTYKESKPDKGIKGKPSEETDKRTEKRKDKVTEKERRILDKNGKSKSSDTYVESKPGSKCGKRKADKSATETSKTLLPPLQRKDQSKQAIKGEKPTVKGEKGSLKAEKGTGKVEKDSPKGEKESVKDKKVKGKDSKDEQVTSSENIDKLEDAGEKKTGHKGKNVKPSEVADTKDDTAKPDDKLINAMKKATKIRDQVKDVKEISEKKQVEKKTKKPKQHLKPKHSADEENVKEVKVVKAAPSAPDLPPKSLLQEHLKAVEKSKKAGKRDDSAMAKAELELEMNKIRMQNDSDILRYAIVKSKGESIPGELPPLPGKFTLLQIATNNIGDSQSQDSKADVVMASKEKKDFLKKFMANRKKAKVTEMARIDSDLEIEIDSYLNRLRPKIKTKIKMIKNTSIIDFNPSEYIKEKPKAVPAFFESTFTKFPSIEQLLDEEPSTPEEVPKRKAKVALEDVTNSNIIRYSLSDRSFIDKGWTLLPTEKVLRKMNIYRMRPARPEFDWFKRNKSKGSMQYDTGERLAEFEEDGRGRCYYRNGRIALDYYNAEETNARQRYVIYSNGEPDKTGRPRPVAVLAMFDYAGNGIVFDHNGKTRLKYNQTEGIVLDPAIGSSHWKWHSLNDPPVLQKVMIDTQMAFKDPKILKLGLVNKDDKQIRGHDDNILAIELENFVKEKSKKLSAQFHPYQIRMKALQINEEFSLKILDQSTIYLLFQDGSTHLKLNLGMVLDNREIVDTETVELGVVKTSLEKFPARTESVEELQKHLGHAQKRELLRLEKENRLHTSVVRTVESADRMAAGLSRPLRTIGNVHACSPCNVRWAY